jgi:hypothetical protein
MTGLMPSGVAPGVRGKPLQHRPHILHTRCVADRRTPAPHVRGRGLSGQAPRKAKGAFFRCPDLSAPPIAGNARATVLRRARGDLPIARGGP